MIGNVSDPKAATTAEFGEFWGELALRFVGNPNVIFGINNEPHDMVREWSTLNGYVKSNVVLTKPTQLILENNQVKK